MHEACQNGHAHESQECHQAYAKVWLKMSYSKSESLPKKKAFLARACQKQKSFMKKVEEHIKALCKERPNKAVAFLALRDELVSVKS